MENPSSRDLTKRVAIAVLLLIVGGAASAMFFADDASKFLFPDSGTANGQRQPMELRGRWLGMSLASLRSEAAMERNLPPSIRGVMVADLDARRAWRARQAGVTPGDVIVGVEGRLVRDMGDLFGATKKVNVNAPILIEVLRWGQPLTLVLPAVGSVPPAFAQAVPPTFAQAVPLAVPPNAAMAAPDLVLNAPAPVMVGGMQAAGVGGGTPQTSVNPYYLNPPMRQVR